MGSKGVEKEEIKCDGNEMFEELVTRIDWISDEEISGRVGLQNKLPGRVENCGLRWFVHVERMDDEIMTKRGLH